jgi:vacuolar-type H+-ATPase subunit E/Vma4
MALADLIAALEADVVRKAAEEREAGQREAERIHVETAQRIAAQRVDLLARHESTRRRLMAAHVAGAEGEVRAKVLAARERVLAAIFERVLDRLPALQATGTYRNTIAIELEDALSYVDGEDDLVVRCAPGLVQTLRPLLTARLNARLEADDAIRAGFRVIANGGRVEVDHTLESRLRRLAPALRIDIVRRLEAVAERACTGQVPHALG